MEDCYFFVELIESDSGEDQIIRVICTKCKDEHLPDSGWFYPGSTEGYGPFDYNCCKCGKSIYKFEEEQDDISD